VCVCVSVQEELKFILIFLGMSPCLRCSGLHPRGFLFFFDYEERTRCIMKTFPKALQLLWNAVHEWI